MAYILSILVLTAFILIAGALFLWRRGGPRRQVILMIVLAAICVVNVAIWTVPGQSGEAPLRQLPETSR